MTHPGRLLIGCFCLVAVVQTGCDSSVLGVMAFGPATPTCETTTNGAQFVSRALVLINEERELRGMKPLVLNDALSASAETYACSMIEAGFFGHDHPLTGAGFSDRHAAGEFRCYPAGENLALGHDAPEQVVDAWMNSPTHRDNILTDGYREMGLAVRQDSVDGRLYWVQLFIGVRVEGCDDPSASNGESVSPPGDLTSELEDAPPLPSDRSHPPLTDDDLMPGLAGPPADE